MSHTYQSEIGNTYYEEKGAKNREDTHSRTMGQVSRDSDSSLDIKTKGNFKSCPPRIRSRVPRRRNRPVEVAAQVATSTCQPPWGQFHCLFDAVPPADIQTVKGTANVARESGNQRRLCLREIPIRRLWGQSRALWVTSSNSWETRHAGNLRKCHIAHHLEVFPPNKTWSHGANHSCCSSHRNTGGTRCAAIIVISCSL
jgi:hypothetical protein